MNARHRTAWTFAITSAALFMASLDNLVVTTALPSIRAHLHASLEGLQWTVNAYTLTFAVLLLTGATLGERYGRRRLFTIGLGLFTAGSAAAALAPGIGALVAARAVQGVGAAIVIPLFHRLHVSPVLGFMLVGIAVGPFGFGSLTTHLPWLSAITISAPASIEPIAHLGVVLLLFMIGLELSFDRLCAQGAVCCDRPRCRPSGASAGAGGAGIFW